MYDVDGINSIDAGISISVKTSGFDQFYVQDDLHLQRCRAETFVINKLAKLPNWLFSNTATFISAVDGSADMIISIAKKQTWAIQSIT